MTRADKPSARIRIRRARRSDGRRILEIEHELAAWEKLQGPSATEGRRLLRMIFDRREVRALVATVGGRVEGIALYWFALGSSFRGRNLLGLEDLVVSQAMRGRGIGEALMAALAREGVRRKAIRMEWDVLDWNAKALRFYRRLGARSRAPWLRYTFDEKTMKALARKAPRG
ncbi:MAG TPA: GNAT family N-acetyltransferase [Thermoanaerobaculia bacterium]